MTDKPFICFPIFSPESKLGINFCIFLTHSTGLLILYSLVPPYKWRIVLVKVGKYVNGLGRHSSINRFLLELRRNGINWRVGANSSSCQPPRSNYLDRKYFCQAQSLFAPCARPNHG